MKLAILFLSLFSFQNVFCQTRQYHKGNGDNVVNKTVNYYKISRYDNSLDNKADKGELDKSLTEIFHSIALIDSTTFLLAKVIVSESDTILVSYLSKMSNGIQKCMENVQFNSIVVKSVNQKKWQNYYSHLFKYADSVYYIVDGDKRCVFLEKTIDQRIDFLNQFKQESKLFFTQFAKYTLQ